MHKFDSVSLELRSKRWGWRLNVIIRDWKRDTLKKISFSVTTESNSRVYFMDRTQLFRGPDSLSPSGINRDYLYRLPITDWEKLQAKANLRETRRLGRKRTPMEENPQRRRKILERARKRMGRKRMGQRENCQSPKKRKIGRR